MTMRQGFWDQLWSSPIWFAFFAVVGLKAAGILAWSWILVAAPILVAVAIPIVVGFALCVFVTALVAIGWRP